MFDSVDKEPYLSWAEEQNMRAEETRIDIYLVKKGCSELGIKLREGKLEIKSLRQKIYLDIFKSPVEVWEKFSQKLNDQTIENFEGLSDPQVATRKQRFLGKLQINEEKMLEIVDPTQKYDRGMAFELTFVDIGEKEYVTFGLESFGSIGGADLVKGYEHLVKNCPFVDKLTDDRVMGYPEFLESTLN